MLHCAGHKSSGVVMPRARAGYSLVFYKTTFVAIIWRCKCNMRQVSWPNVIHCQRIVRTPYGLVVLFVGLGSPLAMSPKPAALMTHWCSPGMPPCREEAGVPIECPETDIFPHVACAMPKASIERRLACPAISPEGCLLDADGFTVLMKLCSSASLRGAQK